MNHIEKLQSSLERWELDAVLLTGAANCFYASGFRTSQGDCAVLVTAGKAYYLTDARYTEAAGRALGKAAELREVGHGKTYSALLQELVFLHGVRRLGFEEASMTVEAWQRYQKAFSCELAPASSLLAELRQVKDASELAAMEAAQAIAECTLEDVLKELRPGVAEREIAARIHYLMRHYGAEDLSFDPIVVAGPNGSLPHGVPSGRKIQAGEFVTLDIGCVYQGYCSDMTRTVAVGFATEEMRRVYQTVLEAQQAGIAAARAGVTGKAVDAAARTVIDAAGYGDYFTHSFGHSLGVEVHESPSAAASNDKPLPTGALISAEPGIYLPGRLGVRIEDVILLTETGNRNLTRAPKELMVL